MGLKQLTPVCEITGGSKTAATIQARLISCTVVDVSGIKSDSITIKIDAQGLDEWPATGQIIGCKMGYKEDKALVSLGNFKLTRISETLYPNTMTITGTAAPFQKDDKTEFKKRRDYTWYNTSLGEVVKAIAKRHGFSPRISADLAKIPILHQDQANETDITFLNRVANYHDAVCKLVDNLLVFAKRGEVKSISGKAIKPVTITHPEVNSPSNPAYISATVSSSDKGKQKGIQARWYDEETAKEYTEQKGSAPYQILNKTYESKEAAQREVNAKQRKMIRQGDKLSMMCPGNTALLAEGLINLEGFPLQKIVGVWSINKVSHLFGSDYRCSLNAERTS
jgi:phage protein D